MSVRKRKWRDAAGVERTAWVVDVQIVDENGRVQRVRRVSRVQTRRAAEKLEHEIREQLLTVGDAPPLEPCELPTLADFAARFLENYVLSNNKPSEIESKQMILRVHLVPELGHVRLDQISAREVEAYKAKKLRSKLARKTINNHLTVLRKMLATAAEWRLLTAVPPFKWLKAPAPEFDFLTFEESDRLIAGASEDWRVMITIALRTGLRLGELLALRWSDVDLDGGRIVVRRAVSRGVVGTPKNGRSREVPLSDQSATALSHHARRGELVFCAADGAMFTKGSTKRPLWRACKSAELRRIGWHVARHSFASHLVMRGVPIRTVQELLGHSTIEMTTRYAHLSPDARRDAVRLLDVRDVVTMTWKTSKGVLIEFSLGSGRPLAHWPAAA